MRIFIISDTHFGHQWMIDSGNRPSKFGEKIIKNWTILVRKDDLVIHLGDCYVGKESELKEIILNLPGRKILVAGNHDKKTLSWYMKNGFDFVCNTFSYTYMGKSILFSHQPIQMHFQEDINIHGHLHLGRHRNEFNLSNKHLLFSLEKQEYKPVLLKTFIENYSNI